MRKLHLGLFHEKGETEKGKRDSEAEVLTNCVVL